MTHTRTGHGSQPMVDKPAQHPDELLLDMHLDRLSDEQRSWIEAELRSDTALRGKSERLGRILQPLDSFAPTTPLNLADRVLARIEDGKEQPEANAAEHLRLVEPLSPNSAQRSTAGSTHRPPFFAMRDLIGAAACILLLVSVFVPGLSGVRERARRTVCANNLGSIFRGTSTYSETFSSSLPFAGCVPGSAWLPGTSERPLASNSRHVYLLLKLGHGPQPADFLCPSDDAAVAMGGSDLASRSDFASARNVSYDSLNLSAMKPNLRATPTRVYISDPNPLFVRARFDDSVDPYTTNSPAHGGSGQTVLALNGSAVWLTKPVYGKRNDNLWLAGNIRRYVGTETPVEPDDVQLIPGFPAMLKPAAQRNRY